MTLLQTHLKSIGACADARKWAGNRTPQQAWDECERHDWLLWWATRTLVNTRQQIVLVACDFAETAFKYLPKGENRPQELVAALRDWADKPTDKKLEHIKLLRKNLYVADAAAAAAAAAAYAYAAAAAAAAAAYAAAAAAAYAADAADAAAYAYAAAAAAAADARKKSLSKALDLIRLRLKLPYQKEEVTK